MKKIILLFITLSLYSQDYEGWYNYIEKEKEKMFNLYFKHRSVLIVKIHDLELLYQEWNRRELKTVFVQMSNKYQIFSEGIYKDFEGDKYRGFRWVGSIFMFDEVDWFRLKHGSDDFICYADLYHISADSTVDYKNRQINNLSSQLFVYTVKKKDKIIEIYKPNGYNGLGKEEFFFSFEIKKELYK